MLTTEVRKMARVIIHIYVIGLISIFSVVACSQAETEVRKNIFQKKSPVTSRQATPEKTQANIKTNLKAAKPQKQEEKKEPQKPKITRTDLIHPSQLAMPEEFGSVKEYWPHTSIPEAQMPRRPEKIIIHIQDAHCNYEAQMNLAKMLEHLYLAYGVTLVLVEGGSRSDSLSYMREYAPKDKRREVADKYLKMGKICGENYLDIAEDYPIDVYGIEKPELYDANMQGFLKLDEIRDNDLVLLANLRDTANALKARLYSKEIQDLEAKKKDYTDEKLKFKDWTLYILSLFNDKEKAGLEKEGLENMMAYDKALILERDTDLKKTELERSKLLEYLTKTLPQAKLKECLANTQDAKENKIKQSQYYNYLKSLLPQGSNVNKLYPNLFAYIDYLNVFDKIDNESLFKELPVLEDAAYNKLLGRNKDAAELYFISKAIETFEGLIEIKITPDETKFYTDNKKRFKVKEWKDFLLKQAKRFGIATNINPESGVLDNHFAFIDNFYRVARDSEDAFLVNSIKVMDERLPVSALTGDAGAFKPNDPNAPKLAVLICGGYHTNTLLELFRKDNIAYAVVAPKVTTQTDKNLYRTVLKEVYTPMSRPSEPAVQTPPLVKPPAEPGLLRQKNEKDNSK